MSLDLASLIAQAAESSPQFGAGVFPATVPGLVMHLDGDYLAYYAAGNDDCEPARARHNAFDRIELMRLRSGAESVRLHLSASGCTKAHRYLIATVKKYQGQRSGRKPKNWAYLREVLEHYEGPRFTPKVWVTREADDGIAYCSHQGKSVIATRDKDMRMLPGWHINWMDFTVTEVPPGAYDVMGVDGLQYGSKWFFLQLLQGDTADNIPGLPKLFGQQCGEARAEKYLAGTTDAAQAQDRVEAAYQDHYGSAWVDALVEQAALLWLRTDAQATIRNVSAAFPEPKRELLAGVDRLEARVTKELNELAKIKGQ